MKIMSKDVNSIRPLKRKAPAATWSHKATADIFMQNNRSACTYNKSQPQRICNIINARCRYLSSAAKNCRSVIRLTSKLKIDYLVIQMIKLVPMHGAEISFKLFETKGICDRECGLQRGNHAWNLYENNAAEFSVTFCVTIFPIRRERWIIVWGRQ